MSIWLLGVLLPTITGWWSKTRCLDVTCILSCKTRDAAQSVCQKGKKAWSAEHKFAHMIASKLSRICSCGLKTSVPPKRNLRNCVWKHRLIFQHTHTWSPAVWGTGTLVAGWFTSISFFSAWLVPLRDTEHCLLNDNSDLALRNTRGKKTRS